MTTDRPGGPDPRFDWAQGASCARKSPAKRGFYFASASRESPRGRCLSAKCRHLELDPPEALCLDPCDEIVPVHRLVELLRIGIEGLRNRGVPGDPRLSYVPQGGLRSVALSDARRLDATRHDYLSRETPRPGPAEWTSPLARQRGVSRGAADSVIRHRGG
jgi:hypothetical protein